MNCRSWPMAHSLAHAPCSSATRPLGSAAPRRSKLGGAGLRRRQPSSPPLPLPAPLPAYKKDGNTAEGAGATGGAAGSAATPTAVSSQVTSLSELPTYPSDFITRRLITFAGIVLGYR